jgi:TfoX/Sxy family transcriptional regulator of competence genes
MAYDEGLAERIRCSLADERGITEKKMFGGIAFLVRGKMFVGVVKNDLMVRVGPDRFEEALKKPAARPMDFTGRPMAGYVYVAPDGTTSDAVLDHWIQRGLRFASTLNSDEKKPERSGRRSTSARNR